MHLKYLSSSLRRLIITSILIFIISMCVCRNPVLTTPTMASGIKPDNSTFVNETRSSVYNYCPSYIIDGQPGVYYCSNKSPGIITDSIYYFDIESKKASEILSPSKNNWDSMHVCDPSVIAGEWYYDNVSYKYLMAYLGCCTTDNQKNQIGLAVSNNKDSGWVKVGEAPLITHGYDTYHADTFQWGVGQPSLINLGNGFVALFYTEGQWNLTQTKCAVYNLYNLNRPELIDIAIIDNTGLTQTDGITPDFMSNADFALSGTRLYVVCDTHPFETDVLSGIPTTSKVYYTDIDLYHFLDSLESCNWIELIEINVVGKNHNCGLARTPYGYLKECSVLYTHAVPKTSFVESLFTYRIRQMCF